MFQNKADSNHNADIKNPNKGSNGTNQRLRQRLMC